MDFDIRCGENKSRLRHTIEDILNVVDSQTKLGFVCAVMEITRQNSFKIFQRRESVHPRRDSNPAPDALSGGCATCGPSVLHSLWTDSAKNCST